MTKSSNLLGDWGTQAQVTDSAELIACMFAALERDDLLTKLRPALFLAQYRLQTTLYSYRLSMGHVASDELAVEIGQLTATGVIDYDASGRAHVSQESASFLACSTISSQQMIESVANLLQEDVETLDAAATRIFFVDEGLGEPADRLAWYRKLPPNVRTRAADVVIEAQTPPPSR